MTSNQIANRKVEEETRSNKEKEAENRRHNKVTEGIDIAKTVMSGASLFKPNRKVNDASWYTLDKQLAKDVANISFNAPLGYPVKFGERVNNANVPSIPGIMVIGFIPTIGNTGLSDTVAKNIYAYVRHANSGSRNYEASDLLMYIYAMDQAYSLHGALCRLYSLLMTSKSENRYYVDAMIRAAGFDPLDLRNHINDLRVSINSYAVRLNSFYCPKDMPLFNRHYWLNNTIFKDQPIKKSQEYMFVQESYGVYDDVAGKVTFGTLKYNGDTIKSSGIKFTEIQSAINQVIKGLIDSEDAGIMSGDILKAYGEGNMLFVPSITESYHIESEYSAEVLSQITNATLVGNILSSYDINQVKSGTKSGTIYQGEYLTQATTAQEDKPTNLSSNRYGILAEFGSNLSYNSITPKGATNINIENVLCNFYKDAPTTDDVLVATRLITVPDIAVTATNPIPTFRADGFNAATEQSTWGFPVRSNGTEIATLAHVFGLNADMAPFRITNFKQITYNAATDNTVSRWITHIMCAATKFDWSPRTVARTISYVEGVGTVSDIYDDMPMDSTDFANYATIAVSSIENMHYVAVISELGIPLLGTKVRSR